MDHHEISECPTRADAFFDEATAILRERPWYNRDIPSLDRYDVLRSRATVGESLTIAERLEALEFQLRQEKRRNRQLSGAQADLEQVQRSNQELLEKLARAASDASTLHDAIRRWKGRAEEAEDRLAGRPETRLFIVEGPSAKEPGTPAPVEAVRRRGLFRRR